MLLQVDYTFPQDIDHMIKQVMRATMPQRGAVPRPAATSRRSAFRRAHQAAAAHLPPATAVDDAGGASAAVSSEGQPAPCEAAAAAGHDAQPLAGSAAPDSAADAVMGGGVDAALRGGDGAGASGQPGSGGDFVMDETQNVPENQVGSAGTNGVQGAQVSMSKNGWSGSAQPVVHSYT